MTRIMLITFLAVCAGGAAFGQVGPKRPAAGTAADPRPTNGSLWNAQTVEEGSLLTYEARPLKQFKKYDIITIVIKEESAGASQGTLKTEKKNDWNMTIDAFSRISKANQGFNVQPMFSDAPEYAIHNDRKIDGNGDQQRSDRFTARVAAHVVDIKPNGNLVLEAFREVSMNREVRTITLTGEVSPQSVSPVNEVFSYYVAGAKIAYKSSGPVSSATRSGWLTRLADFIDPF